MKTAVSLRVTRSILTTVHKNCLTDLCPRHASEQMKKGKVEKVGWNK